MSLRYKGHSRLTTFTKSQKTPTYQCSNTLHGHCLQLMQDIELKFRSKQTENQSKKTITHDTKI